MHDLARRSVLTTALLLGGGLSSWAQTSPVILQPGTEGKDAYIHSLYPTTNAGSHPMLFVTAWTWSGTPGVTRALLQFDLSGVPKDAIVTKAILRLYGDAGDGGGHPGHSTLSGSNQGYVRRITGAWEEASVTWSTQPATTTTDQVVIPASTSNTQSYALEVTNLVQSMLGANYGFMLQLATEQHYRALKFSSSDSTTTARRPRLEVTWEYRYGAGIQYTPYSSSESVNVSWPRGGLLVTKHRLYMQPEGGGWSLAYEGNNPRFTFASLADGRYRFAYTQLRLGRWSNTLTGGFMTVRRRPVLDVVARFPEAATARLKSAQYQAQAESYTDGNGEQHWLGQGYDTMTGETKRLCLETSAGLNTVSNLIREEDTSIDVIQDTEQLLQRLDLDVSAGISASYSGFSGSGNVKVELFREMRMTRSHSMVMVKWQYLDEQRELTSRSVPLNPDYLAMLDPNATTRDNRYFHYDCGDQFVHRVDMGARAYLLVSFDSSSMSNEEVRTTSYDVQARFANKVSASSNGTFSEADKSFFSSIGLKIRGHSEGGPSGVLSGVLSVEDALPSFREFVRQATPDTFVAVNREHILYELPTPWLGRPYYSVFADPRTVNGQLKSWINVDYQVADRCAALREGNSTLYVPKCFSAKEKLETVISNCTEGVRWASCVAPSGSGVLSSLEGTIPAMAETVATGEIPYFHVDSKLSKNCGSRTARATLPSADCILDRTKTYTPLNARPSGNVGGDAFGVFITSANVPNGGSATHQISEINGVPVLDSRVEVCADNWWGAGAWYEGYQELYGRCPEPNTPFILE